MIQLNPSSDAQWAQEEAFLDCESQHAFLSTQRMIWQTKINNSLSSCWHLSTHFCKEAPVLLLQHPKCSNLVYINYCENELLFLNLPKLGHLMYVHASTKRASSLIQSKAITFAHSPFLYQKKICPRCSKLNAGTKLANRLLFSFSFCWYWELCSLFTRHVHPSPASTDLFNR